MMRQLPGAVELFTGNAGAGAAGVEAGAGGDVGPKALEGAAGGDERDPPARSGSLQDRTC